MSLMTSIHGRDKFGATDLAAVPGVVVTRESIIPLVSSLE